MASPPPTAGWTRGGRGGGVDIAQVEADIALCERLLARDLFTVAALRKGDPVIAAPRLAQRHDDIPAAGPAAYNDDGDKDTFFSRPELRHDASYTTEEDCHYGNGCNSEERDDGYGDDEHGHGHEYEDASHTAITQDDYYHEVEKTAQVKKEEEDVGYVAAAWRKPVPAEEIACLPDDRKQRLEQQLESERSHRQSTARAQPLAWQPHASDAIAGSSGYTNFDAEEYVQHDGDDSDDNHTPVPSTSGSVSSVRSIARSDSDDRTRERSKRKSVHWSPSTRSTLVRPSSAPNQYTHSQAKASTRRTTVPAAFHLSEPSGRVTKDSITREVEARLHAECTFTPSVHKTKHATTHTHSLLPLSPSERLARLARPRTAASRREDIDSVDGVDVDAMECTFRPRTGRPPKNRPDDGLRVEERLLKDLAVKRAVMEVAARTREEKELAECTFRPEVSCASAVLVDANRTPVHLRAKDDHNKKEGKKRRSGQRGEVGDVDEEVDFTFEPRISEVSRLMAELRAASDGGDRPPLDEPMQSWRNRVAARGGEATSPTAEECTFAPAINPTSERLVTAVFESEDFLSRQRAFEVRRRHNTRVLESVAAADCTFSPSVSPSRRRDTPPNTTAKSHGIEEESPPPSSTRRERRMSIVQAEQDSQLTFRPHITPNSKKMNVCRQALTARSDGRRLRPDVQQVMQLMFEASCTFQPKTCKYSSPGGGEPVHRLQVHIADTDSLMERIEDYRKVKEAHMQACKEVQMRVAVEQCTFAPKIKGETPDTTKPVVVAGLDRYLELVDMANKQHDAKAERTAKAFRLNPPSPHRPSVTLPQPFSFHDRNCERLAGLAAKVHAMREGYQAKQCTFKPALNQAVHERVERILKEARDGEEGIGV
eukprot:jgi/Chlat1/4330/Chrsp29S00345